MLCQISASAGARADDVADFYRGKTMHMVIGYGAGGGYDLYGRIAAEFLGKHIPGNPTIVPQNMPGAGSFKAAQYLYSAAPKDGTYLGSVSQTLALDTAMSDKAQPRRHQASLSRPPDQQHRYWRGAAQDRHQVVRGRAAQAVHGRNHRRRVDSGAAAGVAQRLWRRQVQAREGLSGRRRRAARGRARRGRGCRRGRHPKHAIAPSRLAQGRRDHHLSGCAQAAPRCCRTCRRCRSSA